MSFLGHVDRYRVGLLRVAGIDNEAATKVQRDGLLQRKEKRTRSFIGASAMQLLFYPLSSEP